MAKENQTSARTAGNFHLCESEEVSCQENKEVKPLKLTKSLFKCTCS